jgi:hypothetical protein
MTKQKFFLSTLIFALFLTACSNSDQPPATQNNPPSQPSQEVKASSDKGASTDDRNVVKAEGAVAVMPPSPPSPQAATPPANAATPANVDPANAPRISLVSKKVDFGKVAPEKNISREIVVKNVGKAALNIESVAPSCGCTTVDFPKVIQPGKSGKIKLKVDTGKGSGPRTKTVVINSNDPQEKVVTVEFSFTLP